MDELHTQKESLPSLMAMRKKTIGDLFQASSSKASLEMLMVYRALCYKSTRLHFIGLTNECTIAFLDIVFF